MWSFCLGLLLYVALIWHQCLPSCVLALSCGIPGLERCTGSCFWSLGQVRIQAEKGWASLCWRICVALQCSRVWTLALCSWTPCTLTSDTLSMKTDPRRDPSECILHICVLWHMHKIAKSFDIFENHSQRALLMSHFNMTKAMKFLFGDSLYFKNNRRIAYAILINGPTHCLIRLNSLSLILHFKKALSCLK